MKRVIRAVSFVLAVVLVFVTVRAASSVQEADPLAELVGTAFTYQGQLKLDGTPVSDTCDMEFRLYADAAGTVQVGSSEISMPVSVADGFFTAELDFGGDAFNGDARWLGIQVQCTGDSSMVDLGLQSLTPAPYAMSAPWSGLSGVPAGFADNVDNNTTYSAGTGLGLDHGVFSILTPFLLPAPCDPGEIAIYSTKVEPHWICGADNAGPDPSKVVVVAKSGGDYTSIQDAIDSISDATEANPYLVWVAPGVYEERVRMAPYVHLQGAGQGATIITNSDYSVMLYLAAYTSLRDLTVIIEDSPYSTTYALLALSSDNVTGTLVANVEVQALDAGTESHGCTLDGENTSVTLLDVTAHAEGGSSFNRALEVLNGATAILEGGSFTVAGGGTLNYAIYTHTSGLATTLEATDVRAVAESTTGGNRGLYNTGMATLRGGLYAAHGTSSAYGIHNTGSEAVLEAFSVTAEASGNLQTRGLANENGASAQLHGGSFTARDGSPTAGLYLSGTSSALLANGISALGEDAGTLNYGVQHAGGSCTIANSVLEGDYFSAYTNGGTLRLSHSRLLGPVGGSPTCLGVSTDTDFYAEECP